MLFANTDGCAFLEVDVISEAEIERFPDDGPLDETDVSLRSYIARIPADRLALYDPAWSDEQVREWDDNFRDDGGLMLICCERDVDVREFRAVLEKSLRGGCSVGKADPH